MKSVSQLRAWRENLKSSLAKVQPIRDQFFATKAKIEADGSRHQGWINDEVGKARDAAYPLVGKHLTEARNLANVVKAEAAAWRSIPYVLSQAKFAKDDPLSENGTRARWHRELSAMPAGLFALVAEDAKRDGNYAALYQCYLVGLARRDHKGFPQIDIGKIEIPEQQEALELIAECATMPAQIEHIIGQINGRNDQNPLVAAHKLVPESLRPTAGFDAPSEMPAAPAPMTAAIDPNALPQERMRAARSQPTVLPGAPIPITGPNSSPLERLQAGRGRQGEAA